MGAHPAVTVICATRNARDAVRLTLASFHRYTAEPCRILIADNDSTDGTLQDLRGIPWLTLIDVEQRRTRLRAEIAELNLAATRLATRLEELAGSLPARERDLLAKLPAPRLGADLPDDSTLTEHGATLDWLAEQVTTPFLLTMDSDVEFLAAGWLGEMLELMERDQLVALGQYEQGYLGYQPRLAPCVMLLRTEPFRALQVSFQGFARLRDPAEAPRWQERPRGFGLTREEMASYPQAEVYPVGAALFARLSDSRSRWAEVPGTTASKWLHLGQMSWGGDETNIREADRALQPAHAQRLTYVRERLRLVDSQTL